MDTLRVSASDLDAYRRFRDNEDVELPDLLAQLRRESPPTPAMLAGTALHTALENSDHGSFDQLSADGYVFDIQAEEEIDLPPLREMKITRDLVVAGMLVTLVGKVDAIRGRRVDDHKFTGNYDAERFLNSYQWRVYLMLFEAEEFRWNVFVGRETGDKHYVISAIHQLRAYAYPGMRTDVLREVAEFVEFARMHMSEKIGREAA